MQLRRKDMKKKQKQKDDNHIVINLAIFSVIAALYFCAVWFLNRLVYDDYLYFCPKDSIIVAFINSCLIILGSFLINKNTIKRIKSNKAKMTVIYVCIACCLLIPFLFFKNGTVADENGIKKIDAFGNVSKVYNYENITKVELGVQYGIQYDITFESGEVVEILSHKVFRLNSFGNSKNIVEFDKIISKHSKKEIYDSTYMTSSNMRSYLTDKESYGYFEDIFGRYY